jgi:hypothetical protein
MNRTYTNCFWSIAFAFVLDHLARGGSSETWYPSLVALGLQRLRQRDERTKGQGTALASMFP